MGRRRAPHRKRDPEAVGPRVLGISEADAELADAVHWYEEHGPGLGFEFLSAVREARQRIERHPDIGSVAPGARRAGVRRLMIRKFPYQVVYYVRRHDIILVAVAHIRRRPGYWNKRALPRAT